MRMSAAPILYVTGKGGSGKTTVCCALGRALAADGLRVLLVESYGCTDSSARLGMPEPSPRPAAAGANLEVVSLDPRALLESYFGRLLRIPALTSRLLSSATFNALTAAAPGVADFLALEAIESWSRSTSYDQIIVDGPATGHALQMLRAPTQLHDIAPSGPLSRPLERLIALLGDAHRWSVALVSLCEEMSIAESGEAHAALGELGIAVEAPLLNRCVERRFSQAERREITAMTERAPDHPLLLTAMHQIRASERLAHFSTEMRKIFGRNALRISEMEGESGDSALGRQMLRGLQR